MLVSDLLLDEAKKKPAAPVPAQAAPAKPERRTIRLSPEFIREFPTFRKAFPACGKALRDFMIYRVSSDIRQGFGQKDIMSTGKTLKGYWHCHLVFGKVILFYKITDQYLDLMAVTDHLTLDNTRRMSSLGSRLAQMDPKTFAVTPVPFD